MKLNFAKVFCCETVVSINKLTYIRDIVAGYFTIWG